MAHFVLTQEAVPSLSLLIVQEKKIKACLPAWVDHCLVTIMDRYSPFADEVDLEVFEKICIEQQWAVDRIIMMASKDSGQQQQAPATAAAGPADGDVASINTGGDMIQISVAESICKIRRSLGILKVGSASKLLSKLPLEYAPRIMDAVSDGISMTVRIRNAGACIRPSQANAGGQGSSSRKRARANAGGDAVATQRPNFANAIDLGNLHEDVGSSDTGSENDDTEDDDL